MQLTNRFSRNEIEQRLHLPALILVWITGLVSGTFLIDTAQDISSLMGTAISSRVSIVSLAMVTLLPLLLSALAVYIRSPFLILPIAFFKAFTIGTVCKALVLSFGSAGWVLRLLLMFSDSIMLIPLFWFWSKHLSGSLTGLRRSTALCVSIAVIVCLLDRCFVSSFLMALNE